MRGKLPFYGRGLAWPIRIGELGGFEISEGSLDSTAIGLAYLFDAWTMNPRIGISDNHIAEAISNILLTHQLEHDTLPEYGSNIHQILFDPLHNITKQQFQIWLEICTKRWEHRAKIPIPQGMTWGEDDYSTDRNTLSLKLTPEIILQQTPENLVSPFVSPQEARNAEYPAIVRDKNGHGLSSRYRNCATYEVDGAKYIRPKRSIRPKQKPDDQFYPVVFGDTWFLIAHKVFQNVELWWVVEDYAFYDAIQEGAGQDCLCPHADPEVGRILRLPSRERVLMEIAA